MDPSSDNLPDPSQPHTLQGEWWWMRVETFSLSSSGSARRRLMSPSGGPSMMTKPERHLQQALIRVWEESTGTPHVPSTSSSLGEGWLRERSATSQ